MNKWDLRYLQLAKFISSWSKDPSTQVGAVAVDKNNHVISLGYNGFAHGIDDCSERYLDRNIKYEMVIHGEENVLLFGGPRLKGATIYTYPFMPCPRCAAKIIQAGIKRVVTIPANEEQNVRWKDLFKLTKLQFKEAKVALKIYNKELS